MIPYTYLDLETEIALALGEVDFLTMFSFIKKYHSFD